MPWRVPYVRIRWNRNYTFEEAADLFGVSIGTVWRWGGSSGCLTSQNSNRTMIDALAPALEALPGGSPQLPGPLAKVRTRPPRSRGRGPGGQAI